MARSRVNIGHTPVGCNAPALDRVEVIDRAEGPVVPADRDQLLECRLDISGLVGASALQHGGLTVPHPGEAEAHRAHRFGYGLDTCRVPGLAAVDRDVD